MKKAVVLLLALFVCGRPAEAEEARKPRKVPCPAQCAASEEPDETQECVWHDKELYKQDGIGCRKYGKVCWCKPQRDKFPPAGQTSCPLAISPIIGRIVPICAHISLKSRHHVALAS